MSDWEIGDKCYMFYHWNDCSLVWHIDDVRIEEEEVTAIGDNGLLRFGDGYEFCDYHAIFKTKADAVNAMLLRLKEILEGE